jgi:hypothetical protein
LLGIRAKIERAKKHIDDFEILSRSLAQDLYEIRAESDPQTGEKLHSVFLKTVPEEVRLIIGDAVHNLWSSLDYLVWQLAESNGGPGNKGHMFPICNSATEYQKPKTSRKVQGIHPDAEKIIDSLKPYAGGNDELWAIHELDIIDKHRLLIVAAAAMSGIFAGHVVRNWIAEATRWSPGMRYPVLKEADIVYRIAVGSPDYDKDFQLTIEIAFGEPKIIEGKPVSPFLHQMAGLVDRIVDLFVPFL